jgi:hypothetical protein
MRRRIRIVAMSRVPRSRFERLRTLQNELHSPVPYTLSTCALGFREEHLTCAGNSLSLSLHRRHGRVSVNCMSNVDECREDNIMIHGTTRSVDDQTYSSVTGTVYCTSLAIKK